MERWDEVDNDVMGSLIDVLGSDVSLEDVDELAVAFKTFKATQRADLWSEFTEWFTPSTNGGTPDFATNPQKYLLGMQQLLTKDLGFLQEAWIRKGLLAIADDPLLRFQWDRYLKQEKFSPGEFWGVLQQMDTNGQTTRHETTQTGFECEVSSSFDPSADTAPEWLVDGLLPRGGFSVLGAKPKVGKTTFAQSLGWAVARGVPFLGRDTTGGRVLHFALEGVRQQDVLTLHQMGGHDDHLVRFGQQLPGSQYDVLAQTIRDQNLTLVIIDTIFRFAKIADMNDYGQVTNAFARLIELGQTTGCHIMAVHHLRKAKGDDVGDQLLGSTAIYGSVDTYIDYQWKDADDEVGDRVLFTRQRYGLSMPKTIIGLDVETGRIVSRGTAQESRRSDLSQSILDAMPPSETPVSKSTVVEGVDARRQDVYKALNILIELGLVKQEKWGKVQMLWVVADMGTP